MRVKRISDGSFGFISPDKFNPQIYTAAEDPSKSANDPYKNAVTTQTPTTQPAASAVPDMMGTIQQQSQQKWQMAGNETERNRIADGFKSAFGFELFGNKAVSTIPDAEQKKIDAKANALRIISQAEDLYFGGNGAAGDLSQGRFTGTLANIGAAAGFNSPLSTYNDMIQTVRPTFARAAGDSGNFSKSEQESAIKLFPKATATPDEAQKKFNAMRKKFDLPVRDFSQIAGAPVGEGLVGLGQQMATRAQTASPLENAAYAAIPALNIYDPTKGAEGFNPTGLNAGADVAASLAVPAIFNKIKSGLTKAKAGQAIEQAATTAAGQVGQMVEGNPILTQIKKIYDAAPSTEKAAIGTLYKNAVKLYKNKQIPVDVANNMLNMANDAFSASGTIGSSAKAAVEAATARGIRTQLPEAVMQARNAYGVVSARDNIIKKLLFPTAVATGAGLGITTALGKLGIGYQGQ
jgi:hypothetical protein